jgi:tetratricopeptide (TPR) repeat protein
LKYYERALSIDPDNDKIYNQLAYVYNQLGDFEKALSLIKKCISLKPDEAYSIDTLGDIYAFNANSDEARDCYIKALDIRMEFQSLRKLGYLHLLMGKYSEAENYLRQLCACSDKNYRSEGRTCLSLIDLHKGQFNSALEILKKAEIADKFENYKGIWEAHKHLLKSLIFETQGLLGKAVEEIENNQRIWQNYYSVPWPIDYIRFLAKKGDLARADRIVGSFTKNAHTNDVRLIKARYFYSGCIELYRKNFNLAVEHLEFATAYLSDIGGYGYFQKNYMLATAYLAQNNYTSSINLFNRLLSIYSVGRAFFSIWSVKMHYHLATAYEKTGQINNAIKHYKEFLNIWKDADFRIAEIDDASDRLVKLEKN